MGNNVCATKILNKSVKFICLSIKLKRY